MPSRLDWRVGAAGAAPLVPEPSGRAPARSARSLLARLVLVALYTLALLAAAVVGFQLGHWQDARAARAGGIVNQLLVEDLAWAQADRALFDSTLDPLRPEHRQALLQAFARTAPRNVRHQLVDLSFQPPDRATITVRVETGSRGPGVTAREERRVYRLAGHSWLHSAEE